MKIKIMETPDVYNLPESGVLQLLPLSFGREPDQNQLLFRDCVSKDEPLTRDSRHMRQAVIECRAFYVKAISEDFHEVLLPPASVGIGNMKGTDSLVRRSMIRTLSYYVNLLDPEFSVDLFDLYTLR